MFLPVAASHSVGGSFSPDTMFRNGVPPHIVWSPVGGTEAVLLKFGSAGGRFAAFAAAACPAPAGTAAAAAGAALSAPRAGRLMLVAMRATAVAQTPDRTPRHRRGPGGQ